MACSVLAATLLLSGCGESDAESELQTQQMLDKGNYEGVIAKITNPVTNDDYMALAAAYMQKAGLGLADLVTVIADSTEDANNEAFAAFVKSVKEKSSSTALQDLEKSAGYYKDVVTDCSSTTLSTSQEDACLYRGLAQTMKASATIGYIADDISNFGDDTMPADPKLKASTCAMQYANNLPTEAECAVSSEDANLTFANTKSYERIQVTIGTDTFDYLLSGSTSPKTTVITQGYCTTDSFSPRLEQLDGNETDTYYVCPITETADAEELTTEALIVDALNDGVESIGGIATEDMQADIDEFKCEVLGGTYNGSCSVSLNQDVTNTQVIDYLNNNN
jgi:hypothetical protein